MRDCIQACTCKNCKAAKRSRHKPRKKLRRITSKKRRKAKEGSVVNIYYS